MSNESKLTLWLVIMTVGIAGILVSVIAKLIVTLAGMI